MKRTIIHCQSHLHYYVLFGASQNSGGGIRRTLTLMPVKDPGWLHNIARQFDGIGGGGE
jgi:hypothetical protein